MSIKPITIIAALALGLATPALAANFTFEYTSNTGNLFTGSFSGNQSGNLVTDITNVAVDFNGTTFSGTLAAYGFFGYNGPGGPNNSAPSDFVLNAATVSFDPLLNNFLFINTVPGVGGSDDLFYIFPWTNGGGNQVATQAVVNGTTINGYNGDYVPANWSLAVAGVPEPATWAMLIGGFCFIGVMSRRRVAAVTA